MVKEFLASHFNSDSKSFDASKKELITGVMKLAATNDELKSQGKKLSGIVAWIIGAAEKDGAVALEPRFVLDEMTVLEEFKRYIAAELQLADGVTIVNADDHADEPKAGEAQPGEPSILELF